MLCTLLKSFIWSKKRFFSSTTELSCLVLLEHQNGRISPSSFPVLSAAKQLTDRVSALIAGGPDLSRITREASQIPGLEKLYVAEDAVLEKQLAEPMAEVLVSVQKKNSFSHILAPASTFGKNVLPRSAGILGVEQISDITKIRDEDTFERPIYAGNAIATVKYSTPGPRILTVRPTAFDVPSPEKSDNTTCPVQKLTASEMQGLKEWKSKVQWVKEQVKQTDRPDLTSAKIIVAGGRALQSEENFQLLHKLAEKLGAAVGATRAAVDAGYAPNDWQVGQTGKVVAPELYIALGISGAIQHLAGMTGSKTIVAINTDAEAPIFDVADYGLVQDLFTALPELQKEIEALESKYATMYRHDSCLMKDVLCGRDDELIRKQDIEAERKRDYSVQLRQQMIDKQRRELEAQRSFVEDREQPSVPHQSLQQGNKDCLDEYIANKLGSQPSQPTEHIAKEGFADETSFASPRSIGRDRLDIYSGYTRSQSLKFASAGMIAEKRWSREQKEHTIRVNFRTDNAFMSLAEHEAKQERAKQLQANLAQQIEEKRLKEASLQRTLLNERHPNYGLDEQELEKRKHIEEERRDHYRVLREMQLMKEKHEMQLNEEKEKERRASLKQDSVAEAWFQAKSESMKLRSSISKRAIENADTELKEGSLASNVIDDSELKKFQESITSENSMMQKLLEDRLTSLNTEVKSQLNAIALKTNALESKSMLSDLELNHLQKKINKLRTIGRQINLPSQAVAKTIIPRVSSARKRHENERDLSVWEIGAMDYNRLLGQAYSKFELRADPTMTGFHQTSMYIFPNGKLSSPDQVPKHQNVEERNCDTLDAFVDGKLGGSSDNTKSKNSNLGSIRQSSLKKLASLRKTSKPPSRQTSIQSRSDQGQEDHDQDNQAVEPSLEKTISEDSV